MAVELNDIRFEFIFGLLCSIFFYNFYNNRSAQAVFSILKWIFPFVMVVAFIPDSILMKEVKLIIAWGFGMDLFMLTQSGRDPSKNWNDIIFVITTKMVHHLTVLCSDNYIEMICYSVCWGVHAFAYTKIIGMNRMITVWRVGNHMPLIVLFKYIYDYMYGTVTVNSTSFLIAIQMVVYRYLHLTCCYFTYGPYKIEAVKNTILSITKPLLYAYTIGFLLYAISPTTISNMIIGSFG